MAHILMVEDDENSRLIIRDLLERVAGCDLIEALSGPDGVGAAEVHQPDLILMDVQLPGFDGFEATRQIKANPLLRHIPIIAVTSYAMSGDERRAWEAGCQGFVSKPFDPTELLAMIQRFLPSVGRCVDRGLDHAQAAADSRRRRSTSECRDPQRPSGRTRL